MKNNKLIVIFGPSASGKTTLAETLNKNYGIPKIISTTSRHIRNNETDGVDYNFISLKEFDEFVIQDKFIEHTEYNGNHYGYLKKDVQKHLDNYHISSVIVDINGLERFKHYYRNHVLSVHLGARRLELCKRIQDRSIEDVNEVEQFNIYERIKSVDKELAYWVYADIAINTTDLIPITVAEIVYEHTKNAIAL